MSKWLPRFSALNAPIPFRIAGLQVNRWQAAFLVSGLLVGYSLHTLAEPTGEPEAQGVTATSAALDTTRLKAIQYRRTLVVAAGPGESIYFNRGGYQHGFGYDLSRDLARDLRVRLRFQPVRSQAAALQLVRQGRADIALTSTSSDQQSAMGLGSLDVACGNTSTLSSHGLNSRLSWSVSTPNDALAARVREFGCQYQQSGQLMALADFYTQRLNQSDTFHVLFNKTMGARLPLYRTTFQHYAREQQLDWQLLAAVSYQESLLDPTAVSPTGVSGIMMLTSATAADLGVADRNDPVQSIDGGSRYLRKMMRRYGNIGNPDRLWFALAAYNMGPGAVDNVRQAVRQAGGDPNSWPAVYTWLQQHQAENSRYTQCMHYVSRIRAYVETIKQSRHFSQI